MDAGQRSNYIDVIATALSLAMGDRNDDYNNGGVGLRDYWQMNGIKSPLQMVDMKMKRALSQLGSWQIQDGRLQPTTAKQVDKMVESMVDLINYAAFVACETMALLDDAQEADRLCRVPIEVYSAPEKGLSAHIKTAVMNWQQENKNADNKI